MEENENSFFQDHELHYFRAIAGRLEKLRDQAMQMRDLHKMHLDVQQNHIMTVLTVATAIFVPLTLIVDWYGMNFTHMPKLDTWWGHPAVAVLRALVALGSLAWPKRRKWL
nr:CorA family divalent cation transporter [Schaalia sp. 19OD2882]